MRRSDGVCVNDDSFLVLGCVCMCRWAWGGGNGHGKVDEIVEEGKAEVTSTKVCLMFLIRALLVMANMQGNTVSRNAKEGDPAVKISGNKVLH